MMAQEGVEGRGLVFRPLAGFGRYGGGEENPLPIPVEDKGEEV
jgi:hypothetical protein